MNKAYFLTMLIGTNMLMVTSYAQDYAPQPQSPGQNAPYHSNMPSTYSPLPTDTIQESDEDSSPSAQWQNYNYKDNGFSISFPTTPTHTHQDLTLPNSDLKIPYDMYVSDPNDKESFLVGYANFPAEINVTVPDDNLKAAVNGILGSTPGGKLMNTDMTQFQNYPAIDFSIEGLSYNMKGRYILVGHSLYQLIVAYDKSIDIQQDYATFMKSFKLIK